MTGGRRPIEYYEEASARQRSPALPLPSAEESSTAEALRAFMLAMRFRRRANRALARLGISFAQWRVLEATWRLIRRSGDAVSHLDVSSELELDEASVSRLMHILSARGWVDHGPDLRFYAWRVWVTDAGEGIVASAYAVVAGASMR